MHLITKYGAALLIGAACLTTAISAIADVTTTDATKLDALEVTVDGQNIVTGFDPATLTYTGEAQLPAYATFSAAPASPQATVDIRCNGTTLTNHSGARLDATAPTVSFDVTNGGAMQSYTVNITPLRNVRTIHFKGTSDWTSTPWVYVYTDKVIHKAWPGYEMTSEGDGWYQFELPEGTTTASRVIFSSNGNSPRYPADNEPGILADFAGREAWYLLSDKKWYESDPEGPQKPAITVTPAGGRVRGSSVITISISHDATSVAGTFGETAVSGLSVGGGSINVGDFLADGQSGVLSITASNEIGETNFTATFNRDDSQPTTSLTGDWRELSIYQVMVGSFQHGEGGASGYSDMWGPAGHRKNGNLRGIINALDYIKELGMNAIWMTPIFDSSNGGNGDEKLKATGYFCNDYFKVDPHFGTEEDFDELVQKAHEKGIYIILDGVFGHHSNATGASPNGNYIDNRTAQNVRGTDAGNISFPGSLAYFKEVVRYWMERGVDGWRLDQCYQVYQGGHNYWNDLRMEVEAVSRERKNRGETWGTLGYMVGEDWTSAANITVTQQDGLKSVMDFDGKDNLVNLGYGVGSIGWFLANDAAGRSYRDSGVNPTIFLSNHDTARVGDVVDVATKPEELMTRHAAVACYSGPACTYYGDEIGDKSGNGNADNKARTSGRLSGFNQNEQRVHDYVAKVFTARGENPALWRGTVSRQEAKGMEIITKYDAETQNKVVVVFSDHDADNVNIGGTGVDLINGGTVGSTISVKAWVPAFIRID